MNASISRFALRASAPALLALSACQGPETSPAAPPEEASRQGTATVLLSEEFSDAGKIEIVSDGSGNLGSAFQARIGSQAEKLLNRSLSKPTLAEVYRELKGGTAEVPEAVARASEQIRLQTPTEPSASALPSTEAPLSEAPSAETPLAKAATTEDAFRTGYCHDFREAPITWKKLYCWWDANISLTYTIASSGDRVYAWNHSPYTAKLKLVAEYTNVTHPWQPTLQPYWVTWFNWGAGNFVRAKAYMYLPTGGSLGELGITTHTPIYDKPK